MTKIKNKLLFAFGITILVLVLEIVLITFYSKKSARTHDQLEFRITPALDILNKFDAYNKELYLLSLTKTTSQHNQTITNSIKKIIEVELPYLNDNTSNLMASFSTDDPKHKAFTNIIVLSTNYISSVKQLISLLNARNDYTKNKKLEESIILLNDKLSIETTNIKHAVASLRLDFNIANEIKSVEFRKQLSDFSLMILVTSLGSICIIIFIAYKTVKSIVSPITLLKEGAKRIARGDYNYQVELEGRDEISALGKNFNKMARSLGISFDSINKKNRELEQFVYIASHDLQEPLRTISSFSELLLNEYSGKLDETGDRSLYYISQAAKRMQYLVKDLMDYGRLGKEKKLKTINCKELVKGVKIDLSALISDNDSQLIIGELPSIKGYEQSIHLLFLNLINNALKFKKLKTKSMVEVLAEEEENFWKFGIKDNGIGIATENHEKIFSIFKRLHSKGEYEGTGIGLAHCQKVVELHGGKIWVDSEVNKGSTFYFTISKKIQIS